MKPTYPILILDDDEAILKALLETLKLEGYTCHGTTHVKEALELLSQKIFAVVLSDQRMAELNGICFLQQVKEMQAKCSRILITGVLTSEMFLEAINNAEVFRCLAKPWIREHLIQTIKEAYGAFETKLAYEEAHQALLETNQHLIDENIQLRHHQ